MGQNWDLSWTNPHNPPVEEHNIGVPREMRQEFSVDRHVQLIEDRGVKVLWEKSYLCPCRNKMTKAPNPLCQICHGRGIGYLPARSTWVAIQNQEKGIVNRDIGLYDSGTAIGTTLPQSEISFRDRLTVSDVEVNHSLLFDITRHRVDNGMWLAYDTKRLTYVASQDGELLYEGDDYTFDEEKNLFFPKERLIGKNITLNLTSTLRYVVTDLLKESRVQYTNKGTPLEKVDHLARKLLLKREDAFVNPTPFSTEDGDDTPTEYPTDRKREIQPNDRGGFFGGALNG